MIEGDDAWTVTLESRCDELKSTTAKIQKEKKENH